MRVLIRTDSSIEIGSGHLMRCLTLANELRRQKAEVSFICRQLDGHLINKLEVEGYNVYKLSSPERFNSPTGDYRDWLGVTQPEDAAETLKILKTQSCDWMIIDHYALDQQWEKIIRPHAKKIMVIDDLANRVHDCDVLLDQNYFGSLTSSRYEKLIPEQCSRLLGTRFALLQPEYKQCRHILPPHDGLVERVLIYFGSTDASHHTASVLKDLTCHDMAHLRIDVVIGNNYPDHEEITELVLKRPRTVLHHHLSTLAGLMMRADVMIGAGGTTTWERLCMGLPSIVIPVAENQTYQTHLLIQEGLQISPIIHHTLDWKKALQQLMNNRKLVQRLSHQALELVDGWGLYRVTGKMNQDNHFILNLRSVHPSDAKLLWEWVNDPDVRDQSFSQHHISYDEHTRWFHKKHAHPDCLILIGENESGLPIGQVRFDINRHTQEASIDISIDTVFRGMGLSEKLLHQAIQQFRSKEPDIHLIAEVKETNHRSARLFSKLQFTKILPVREQSKKYKLFAG